MPSIALSTLLALSTLFAASATAAPRDEAISFTRDVAPILLRRCVGCHGPKKSEGGYRLHTFEGLLSAGDSEAEAVVPGAREESELLVRVTESDDSLRMPQEDDPLEPAQIEVLRRWIRAGAGFDGSDPRTSYKLQLPPRRHPAPPPAYHIPVPVQALDFSPDGRQLAVSGYHEITIWDVASGELARRVPRLPQRIQAISWFAPEKLLVGGGTPGDYGELVVVDLANESRRVLGTFEEIVLDAATDLQHRRVAVGTAGHQSRVYALESGKLIWEAGVHSGSICGITFTADDQYVLSASKDQTVKVHVADSGALFTTFNGHRMQFGQYAGRFAVFDVTFDRRSGRALSVGEGRAIRVWDPALAQQENGTAADMEKRFAKAGHTRYIVHRFSQPTFRLAARDGQVFAAGANGDLKQFDVETGDCVRTYAGHTDWIYAAAYAPQVVRAASGAFDGEVRIWDTATGECLHAFQAAPGGPVAAAANPR